MPRSIALLLGLATMLALPAAALADDVLLDTFEGETVGSEPVSPDIGSYFGTPRNLSTIMRHLSSVFTEQFLL
jgi:hypothetical protein